MLSLLKSALGDILYIYKNFGHWIVSKILITLSRYVLAFLFILPFLVVLIIVVWISPYSFFEYELIIQDIFIAFYPLGNNFLGFNMWTILISILFIFMVIGGVVGVFYNRMLLAKLNLQYILRKNLKYKKNLYFDRKMFTRYLKLSGVLILILILPVIVLLVGLILLFFLFGGTGGVESLLNNGSGSNIFSVISFLYMVACIVLFLYLLFRLYFSYFILVGSNKKTIKECIVKSFTITKGSKKLLKFIGLMGILFIIYIPFSYVSQLIDFNTKSISYYMGMKEYVGDGNPNDELSGDEFYAYSQLSQQYGSLSQEELLGKARFMNIISWIYFLFHFVCIYGILDMILAGFYKRELLKK